MRSERGAKKEKEKRKLSTALGCIPLMPSPLTEPRRILRESRALHVKKRSHFLEDDNPAHSRRRYNEIGGNALSTVGRDPCLCRFGARVAEEQTSRRGCLREGCLLTVIEAIEKGNLKFAIKSAIDAGNKDQGGVGESQAGNEAQRCRNSFGKRRRTPISYRNKAVHDLSAVLQSIASLLL
ncbi:hypothetical protein Gohar_027257 [Gossypium harknessii]|uniref:Uncharacterized protein n=1 Tax=Gossypium harknessii TaxID=34285 RepID=A0A7J9HU55_9ROSI|nr:hypothetical protein [Gossypium harknessii]